MIQLSIQFQTKWLEEQRARGVRVVRMLEKWLAGREGVRLKQSTPSGMVVELEESRRPTFENDLEGKLAEEFGDPNPRRFLAYCGKPRGEQQPAGERRREAAEKGGGGSKSEPEEGGAEGEKKEPDGGDGKSGPEAVLADLLGRVPFKHNRALAAHLEETAAVIPMLKRMDAMDSFWGQCLLVSIDDGYGLTEFLGALAELYAAFGLLPGGLGAKSVREIKVEAPPRDEERLAPWERAAEAAKEAKRANERNGGGRAVLCLDVGAWQSRLGSAELKAPLRRINANGGNYTLVFRVPFVDARTEKAIAEALGDIFNVHSLTVPPADLSSLTDYAREELAKRSFLLDGDAVPPFEQWMLVEKSDDSFFGYRTVDKMVHRMIYGKALANCRTGQVDRSIHAADMASWGGEPGEGDPRAELEALIGLGDVKAKIAEIVEQIKTQRRLAAKGRKVKRPAIHMMFTGNPGTGKTTVARIAARMLQKEGVLRKGHLLEVKGRDLCGEYVGQTAPRTSAICRDAYGSVLFIDEAYSLFRGEDSGRDYGREALDTLIAEMENHRDDLCVIMAGYPDEMETLMKGNSGLRSRIPYAVEFPNYSREELCRIFFAMADGNFEHEKALEKAVEKYFGRISDEALAGKSFSNARFVRNLYERTWGKAACRSRLGDGDVKLLARDLDGAAEEREFRQLLEKTERTPMGFVP